MQYSSNIDGYYMKFEKDAEVLKLHFADYWTSIETREKMLKRQ